MSQTDINITLSSSTSSVMLAVITTASFLRVDDALNKLIVTSFHDLGFEGRKYLRFGVSWEILNFHKLFGWYYFDFGWHKKA